VTPEGQRSLPWLLRCEEHQLESAARVLTAVRAAAVATRAADLDRLGSLVRRAEAEHGMFITLIMHPRDEDQILVETVVDESLLPADHEDDPLPLYRLVGDLLGRALEAPRLGSEVFEDPQGAAAVALQVARMASRSDLHGPIEDLKADHVRATPLRTGGLHVLIEGGTIDSEFEEPWCVPGAVVVCVTHGGHPSNRRTVLRLAAEGWMHDVDVPDALGRLRLEADVSARAGTPRP